jgi:RNA polymerase sigma factor (sigma-70 family)
VAVEQVVRGASTASAEAAYDEFQRDLFTYAIRLARDESLAEDAVQTAFLQLVRQLATGRRPDNVRAWLYRVCGNEIRGAARRRRVADRWRSWFGRTGDADPPDVAVLGRERRDAVALALARLPFDQRRVFLLSLDGFSGPEIARLLGRSEVGVRTLLFRARTAIRADAAAREGHS